MFCHENQNPGLVFPVEFYVICTYRLELVLWAVAVEVAQLGAFLLVVRSFQPLDAFPFAYKYFAFRDQQIVKS